jgi:hypothetical protein
MTWGIGGWGISPWGMGGGGGGGLSILACYAVTKRTIRVELSLEPMHRSGFLTGDATNPKTWTVYRVDTGAALTVLAVSAVGASALVYDLAVGQDLGPAIVQHYCASMTLLDVYGAPVGPLTAALPGAQDEDDFRPGLRTGLRRYQQRDLAAVNMRTGTGGSDAVGLPGGTLSIDSTGNYQSTTGIALTKKMILRRLTTRPGGFFHLPEFGAGIAEKGMLPGGGLIALKAEIERQVKREPEVATASVRLSQYPGGVLQIDIAATTRPDGARFDFSMQTGGA